MWRALGLWVGLVVVLGASTGCTKRAPLETGTLDPRQRVVITFADSTQIVGKVGLDERVDLHYQGHVYRGRIEDVTLDDIALRDCRLLRSMGDQEAQWSRVIDAHHELEGAPQEFSFRRADITRIEQIKLDSFRTASQSLFWMLAGAVYTFLLAERS
jgi:hypothetical protein